MEVHFTPELQAKLTHSAARHGRNPDELVQEVLAGYFEEEARFVEAVQRGAEGVGLHPEAHHRRRLDRRVDRLTAPRRTWLIWLAAS